MKKILENVYKNSRNILRKYASFLHHIFYEFFIQENYEEKPKILVEFLLR